MKVRGPKILRGFSIVETLLVLLIGSLVLGGAIVGISAFRERRATETAKYNFLLQMSALKQRISEDIKEAVFTNGFSADINARSLNDPNALKFFGLGTTVKRTDPPHFELQIFRPFNQFLSVPVSITDSRISISRWDTINSVQKTYWLNALNASNFLLVSNDKKSFIFPRSPLQSEANLRAGSILPTTTGSNGVDFSRQSVSADYLNSSNILRTVERVVYRHQGSNTPLIRIGHFQQTQDHVEILADRVRSFQVGYTFRRREKSDVAIIPPLPPTQPFSAFDLPQSLSEAWEISRNSQNEPMCTNPYDSAGRVIPLCVRSHNINQVYVRLVIETDLPPSLFRTRNEEIIMDHEDMRIRVRPELGQQRVVATVDFSSSPRAYSDTVGQQLASGQFVECDPSVAANRCQPNCTNAYKSLNRTDVDWIGYGRYVGHPEGESSYCKCWTAVGDWNKSGARDVKEDHGRLVNWKAGTPQQTEQLEACGREYGCAGNWAPWKHPGYNLGCDCLRTAKSGQVDDYFILKSPIHKPRFETGNNNQIREIGGHHLNDGLGGRPDRLSLLDPNLISLQTPNLAPLNRSLRCFPHWWKCMADVRAYFSRRGQGHLLHSSYSSPTNFDFFVQRCQCLSREIPYACDTAAIANGASPSSECLQNNDNAQLYRATLSYDQLCNRDFRINSSNSKSCPAAWTSLAPGETNTMQYFQANLSSILP